MDAYPSTRRQWTPLFVLACAGVALVLAFVAGAAIFADDVPTVCAFRRITGVPCATCGGTRATIALATGDVGAAVLLNPLVTLGWIGGAAWLGLCILARRVPTTRILDRRGVWVMLACALAANWAYVILAGHV